MFEPFSPESKAIDLARKSLALGYHHTVDSAIRRMLERKKGDLVIRGWGAEKKGDETYLVSFVYNDKSGENGFFFEVNLAAEIVRSILGDPVLEKKYDLEEMGAKMRRDRFDESPGVKMDRGV